MISGINIFLEHIYDVCRQRSMSLEQALSAARGFGYSGLECDLWRLSERSMRELFARCGLHAESVYCGFDLAHDARERSLARVEECLDTAEYYGVRKVLAIPGFAESADELSRVVEYLSEMCRMAASRGITVSVEDYDDSRSPCSTSAKLLYLLENVGGLRITFDTGNFAYSLEDAGEAYNRLSPYIVHVHLKDRAYTRLCEGDDAKADVSGRLMYSCAVGSGSVDVRGVVSRLMESGWSGSLSAEHFGAADQLSCMERSAAFIRGLVEV